jgi:glycosyltransferase involved in cell wall biosynthesis
MSSSYPKVLIIGQMFDKESGGGITLTNLFFGWDSNNIAVVDNKIENPDFSVCKNVYCIGTLEIERGFPFNLKRLDEKSSSGIIDINTSQKKQILERKIDGGKLEKLKDYLITITGQIHRRRRFVKSKEFSKWLTEFSPDIIYSQLSSLEIIRFVKLIHEDIKKPLVLHIMDDWPETITFNQKGIFRLYWTHLINKELRQIFKKADVLMSISESMSEEYYLRYRRTFIPFHNPIDVNNWTSKKNKDYSFNENFKILYAGRIGTGVQNCLLDITTAIRNLIKKGLKIELHIQATTDNTILKELAKFDFVTLQSQVTYYQLPDIFSSADLLLLPNDFDKKSVSFLKYSMPTKASEYMVSGTPILVFSSSETAIAKHALKYGWAYVVSENSLEKLEAAISKLYEDKELRRELGSRAKAFAIKNFDSGKIRENFKNAIRNQQ